MHWIAYTEISNVTGIFPSEFDAALWTNSWLLLKCIGKYQNIDFFSIKNKKSYTSGTINPTNSDKNKNAINKTHDIEIAAPVLVGWVRSFGIFR